VGNRKTIAKFLMRTFTCRTTFLYALPPPPRFPYCILQHVGVFPAFSFEQPYAAYRMMNFRIFFFLYRGQRSEPVFVNLLRIPGIYSQSGGPVRKPFSLYRHARLLRLAESISRNRFLGSINVYKYGLRTPSEGFLAKVQVMCTKNPIIVKCETAVKVISLKGHRIRTESRD
jgi:hypothetical protein